MIDISLLEIATFRHQLLAFVAVSIGFGIICILLGIAQELSDKRK